jgi:hypothetical protein
VAGERLARFGVYLFPWGVQPPTSGSLVDLALDTGLRGAQRERCPPPNPPFSLYSSHFWGRHRGRQGAPLALQWCPPAALNTAGHGLKLGRGGGLGRPCVDWVRGVVGHALAGTVGAEGLTRAVQGCARAGGFSFAEPRPPLRGYSAGVIRQRQGRCLRCPKRNVRCPRLIRMFSLQMSRCWGAVGGSERAPKGSVRPASGARRLSLRGPRLEPGRIASASRASTRR